MRKYLDVYRTINSTKDTKVLRDFLRPASTVIFN